MVLNHNDNISMISCLIKTQIFLNWSLKRAVHDWPVKIFIATELESNIHVRHSTVSAWSHLIESKTPALARQHTNSLMHAKDRSCSEMGYQNVK